MSTTSFSISDDVCRARYDKIVFAAQRCGANRHDASVDGALPTARRRWLLELGAMSLLESELESCNLAMDDGTSTARAAQGRGQEGGSLFYRSSLEGMLERHYDTLSSLSFNLPGSNNAGPDQRVITGSCDTIKGDTDGPIKAGIGGRPVEVSTLLGILPGLGAADDSPPAMPAAGAIAPAATKPTKTGIARSGGVSSTTEKISNNVTSVQHQQHGAPAVTGRPVNPYEVGAGPQRSNSASTTAAMTDPSLKRSLRDVVGGGVDQFPAAGGKDGTAARRASSPQRFPRQQQQKQRQQQQQQQQQHRPHHQQQQQQRGQHQLNQRQTPLPYGGGEHAVSSFPGARVLEDPRNVSPSVSDAWAARDPPPPTRGRGGGLFGEGGAGGTGHARSSGPFKTAGELRAVDIAGNRDDASRRRGGGGGGGGGEQPRRWDRGESEGGGERGIGGGSRGNRQGPRGYGTGSASGYNSRGGHGYNNVGDANSSGNRYATENSFDGGGDAASFWDGEGRRQHQQQQQQQPPTISPRLPNGSGLVRKRKFVPPGRLDNSSTSSGGGGGKFPGLAALGGRGSVGGSGGYGGSGGAGGGGKGGGGEEEEELPEELRHLEKAMVDKILQEVQQKGDPVTFDQIAGLEFAKKSVIELVCWPMERPDIFTGLRSLPKGLLLFGPPGTGKTLIGKAIAHQSGATFFSISASSLCSKWIGEGEKMVRTLFAVAGYHQPAVIFIDEVDSMLSMRSADENEASRRLKTEFLIQLDGAGTKAADRVLVVGATNRPQELDEAARRRFVKRLYVPLPDKSGRRQLMNILLKTSVNCLTAQDIEEVVEETEGFSGADLHALCTEAAMGPVRDLGSSICSIKVSDVPPMETRHFTEARRSMRPSVGGEEITHYLKWNEEFGSFKRS